MPITVMLDTNDDTFPEGAYCVLPGKGHNWTHQATQLRHHATGEPITHASGRPYWTGVLVLGETHHGLCLEDRERNMRDDSDFIMTVWNPEKGCAETIEYASTRGWSYPCYASRVDATPEVRLAWEAWKAQERRRAEILGRWQARRSDRLLAADLGLPSRFHARRLRLSLGQRRHLTDHEIGTYPVGGRSAFLSPLSEDFAAVARLLRTRRFRSEFRASLAEQARKWAEDLGAERATPLSPKQLRYI